MQVSEADIEPVESLPHLADLQQAALPAAELKVGRRGEGGEGAVVALFAPAPTPKTSPPTPFPQALLAKTAVLKLNGGLGTSMGLEKAKSLLPVKGGKSFLDLIAEQVNRERGAVWGVGAVDGVRRLARGARARRPHLPHPSSPSQIKHTRTATGSHVRFILMDSFSTSADTRAALAATHPELIDPATPDWELLQNASPKLDATTLEPVAFPADPELEWCPPGHGDIYAALSGSGMLDRLIGAEEGWESVWERGERMREQCPRRRADPSPPSPPRPPPSADGVVHLFVSNSDNLGATLDTTLLAHAAASGAGFVMEVAERTDADKKGGHLALVKGGGLTLRESAQCADGDKAAFEDVSK